MRKKSIIALSLLLFSVALFGQSLQPMAADYQQFIRQQPAEKVYLQYDRPYYVAGDTIYFKAYVTLGEQHYPSQLSGVLYADMLRPDNSETSNHAVTAEYLKKDVIAEIFGRIELWLGKGGTVKR